LTVKTKGLTAMARVLILAGLFFARSTEAQSSFSVFEDTRFRRGFLLLAPDSSQGRRVEAVLKGPREEEPPVWFLCQWATGFSLKTAPRKSDRQGNTWWENAGKKVLIGSGEKRDLTLEIRGKAEYREHVRREGEAWPHLLVEQDAKHVITLDRLEALRLRISLRLLYFEDHMKQAADPRLHAAQFQLFLVVRNLKCRPEGRSDYFWFGVPFFDNRHEIPKPYRARDAGKADATGKLIYTIGGRNFLEKSLKDGSWHHVAVDLLPFIKEGISYGWKKGFLRSAEVYDYGVVNMNMGWEIPGAYSGAVRIRDFALSAQPIR